MDFCPDCGAMLLPKDGKLQCKCGYVKETSQEDKEKYNVKEKVETEDNVKMLGEDINILPTVNEHCPKCGHDKAGYKLLQTRSADEAPTRIFTCLKCKHTWRAYD